MKEQLRSEDPDETEGRRLYRARANKLAQVQIAIASRKVVLLDSTHIRIGDRKFIVKSDDQGPRIIYERCLCKPGHPYLAQVYDKTIWHRDHSRGHGPKTLPGKIIAQWHALKT